MVFLNSFLLLHWRLLHSLNILFLFVFHSRFCSEFMKFFSFFCWLMLASWLPFRYSMLHCNSTMHYQLATLLRTLCCTLVVAHYEWNALCQKVKWNLCVFLRCLPAVFVSAAFCCVHYLYFLFLLQTSIVLKFHWNCRDC